MNSHPNKSHESKEVALDVLCDETRPLLSESKRSQYNSVNEVKISIEPLSLTSTQVGRLTQLLDEIKEAEDLLDAKLQPAYDARNRNVMRCFEGGDEICIFLPIFVVGKVIADQDFKSVVALISYLLAIVGLILFLKSRSCLDYQVANLLTIEEQNKLQQTVDKLGLDVIVDQNDRAQIGSLLTELAHKKREISFNIRNIPKFNQAFFKSIQELRVEGKMPSFPKQLDELVLSYVNGR